MTDSTQQAPTITEFLEARIAEDEQQAAKHQESASRHGWGDYTARVLAECAAKRAILAARKRSDRSMNDDEWTMGYSDANYDALYALAAVYADHSDYQQEWSKES